MRAASRKEAGGTLAPRSSATKHATAEQVGDDRTREAVLVARRGTEDDGAALAAPTREPGAEPPDDPLRDRGGTVLVGDAEASVRPAATDVTQRRHEQLVVDLGRLE